MSLVMKRLLSRPVRSNKLSTHERHDPLRDAARRLKAASIGWRLLHNTEGLMI
jgi:hypothetical protein